jgi:lipoprotein-anchoring transpeptidase ErfK/SrfK
MEEVMLTRIILGFILAIAAFAAQPLFDRVSDSEVAAASHNTTVEVQPGDTLSAIAAQYGTTVQALVDANQIQNPDLIFPGQVFVVPDGHGTQAPQQTAPAATPPPGAPVWEAQWVEVDLTNQIFRAWEGDQVVHSGVISSGRPAVPTLTGTFETWIHLRYDHMSGWTPDRGSYSLANVPYVMYYDGGYGLHGTYWHNNFGTPQSAGCVNMTTADAGWVFNWSGGPGLTVHIHGTTPGG